MSIPVANGRQSVGIPHSALPSRKIISIAKKVPELNILEKRNWLIHQHYARKEFGICKILIQEELEKSKGQSEYANYLMGLILRHEGKIQESLEYFQICHTLNPRNADNIKQAARSLYLLGRHRLAVEAYLEAENIISKADWDIYHNLGICLLHLDERSKAKEYIARAIQLRRQECSFVALAKIHLLENDLTGAIDVYKAAVDYYPDNSELATTLGLLYMRAEQYQKAFEKFGSALAHDPVCSKALLGAGSMMQKHGDHDVALSKYKIATRIIPESGALWNNIGMCFFGKKKFVAAVSCLKRANYLTPFDWKTLYNLGLVHLSTQQYASAFHFLSASINLHPTSGDSFHLLAVTLKNLCDYGNAKQAFDQAIRLKPEDPAIHLNYAILHFSQSDIEKSVNCFKKFQELISDNSEMHQSILITANELEMKLSRKVNSGIEYKLPEETSNKQVEQEHEEM